MRFVKRCGSFQLPENNFGTPARGATFNRPAAVAHGRLLETKLLARMGPHAAAACTGAAAAAAPGWVPGRVLVRFRPLSAGPGGGNGQVAATGSSALPPGLALDSITGKGHEQQLAGGSGGVSASAPAGALSLASLAGKVAALSITDGTSVQAKLRQLQNHPCEWRPPGSCGAAAVGPMQAGGPAGGQAGGACHLNAV